jgi:hypothetical protein
MNNLDAVSNPPSNLVNFTARLFLSIPRTLTGRVGSNGGQEGAVLQRHVVEALAAAGLVHAADDVLLGREHLEAGDAVDEGDEEVGDDEGVGGYRAAVGKLKTEPEIKNESQLEMRAKGARRELTA